MREKHGADYDPDNMPADPVVIYDEFSGRAHGRYGTMNAVVPPDSYKAKRAADKQQWQAEREEHNRRWQAEQEATNRQMQASQEQNVYMMQYMQQVFPRTGSSGQPQMPSASQFVFMPTSGALTTQVSGSATPVPTMITLQGGDDSGTRWGVGGIRHRRICY